jgi:4'-phosphopantetheinyl transferase
MPVSLVTHDLKVDAAAPLDFDYPDLAAGSAVCIGLSMAWQQREVLHTAAVRDTHPSEHARAARYLRYEDSLRHLLGRALLRRAAAHYGGMETSLPMGANPWGKPQLAGCSIGCNVSHAGNQVWVAVSSYEHVGIDVESATAPPDFRDIATGFHAEETRALRNAADPGLATMRCWTRKEAVAKAIGMGLSLPLDAYAVECGVQTADWLRIAPPATCREAWTTVDLPVGDKYVGALAIDGQCNRVTVVRLSMHP